MDALDQLEQAHQEVLKLPNSGFAASLLSDARQALASQPAAAHVNWRAVCLCVAILCAASMLVGVLVAGIVPGTPTVDAEREYYRGVYDSCTAFATRFVGVSSEEAMSGCTLIVSDVREQGWYKTESDGFEYK